MLCKNILGNHGIIAAKGFETSKSDEIVLLGIKLLPSKGLMSNSEWKIP
jgi:hypothetical protein